MSSWSLLPRILLVALLPLSASASEAWSQLSIGMSQEETLSALGEPVLRNTGRGLELWIYDNHAEVLFLGNVIGWSTPVARDAPRKTADVWQANGGRNDYRTVLLMLPPPKVKPQPAPNPKVLAPWRPPLRYWR